MTLRIERVNAIPAEIVANTMYIVAHPSDANLCDFYMTSSDGQSIRHLATRDETIASTIHYGVEPPPLPSPRPFWWNAAEATLYVQYNDGNTTVWVESIQSIAVPEFAGTGEANTMARSDHNHDDTYLKVGTHEW